MYLYTKAAWLVVASDVDSLHHLLRELSAAIPLSHQTGDRPNLQEKYSWTHGLLYLVPTNASKWLSGGRECPVNWMWSREWPREWPMWWVVNSETIVMYHHSENSSVTSRKVRWGLHAAKWYRQDWIISLYLCSFLSQILPPGLLFFKKLQKNSN